jgi:LysM repeat protein
MKLGELAKLKIIAYKDAAFSDSTQVGGGLFFVQVNPESYSINYSAVYKTKEQTPGGSGYDPNWEKNLPRTMSFEFLFDGTGAIPSFNSHDSQITSQLPQVSAVENIVNEVTSRVSVSAQIEFFENTVFNIRGDTHVPNYLLINWGTLVYKCRLQEMSITYKLFSPEGLPLRATANATFIEVCRNEDKIPLQSPDITHIHQVQEGDTLPLMAKRIYGDERYYIAVAQANKLVQFRDLKPGQQIYFPPIQRG